MKFDEIFQWTGTCGVYQVCIYTCFFTISFTLNDSLGLIFPIARMPHFCRVPQLASLPHALQKYIAIPWSGPREGREGGSYSQCDVFAFNYSAFQMEDFLNWNRSEKMEEEEEVVQCDQWIYEQTMFTSTAVSRFDLVCSREYLVPLIATSFMCGLLVGGASSGTISDRFGRKRAVAAFLFIRLVGLAFSTISPSYIFTVVGRFLIGVGFSGVFLSSVVLCVELVPLKQRAIIIVGSSVARSAGFVAQTFVAYFVRDDVRYLLVSMLPSVFLFIFLFILPESLRWLILKGKHDEAMSVIRRYMTVNGRNVSSANAVDTRLIELVPKKTGAEVTTGKVENTGGLSLFVRRPQLRTRTLIMNFTWFTISMMYFALLLNVGTFAGDIYINTMISGALEIPARTFSIFLVDSRCLGRRLTNAGLLLLIAVSSAIGIALIVTGIGSASTVVPLVGKTLATMSFSVLFIYTAELYPTQIRSVALGTTSVSSRIGGMVAPYMGAPMIRLWKPLPFLVYGILGTFASLLGLLLPETLGQSLMDTVEQTEQSAFNGNRSRNGRVGTSGMDLVLPVERQPASASETATAAASHWPESSVTSPSLKKSGDSIATSDNSITLADDLTSRVNGDSDKAWVEKPEEEEVYYVIDQKSGVSNVIYNHSENGSFKEVPGCDNLSGPLQKRGIASNHPTGKPGLKEADVEMRGSSGVRCIVVRNDVDMTSVVGGLDGNNFVCHF